MSEASELVQKAEQLRREADCEGDAAIRERLTRMAERYEHLAQSRATAAEHPTSAASIADVFIKPH